jgi:GNAT superfamily N-acetyltransferase
MEISIQLDPAPGDIEFIQRELRSFNLRHAPDDNYLPLTIFVRNSNDMLIGGLLGETYWGWLHISILWIDPIHQRSGYGSQVLEAAEREAIARGCHSVHLETMSFQAVEFYVKQGYTTFGVLNDMPRGHHRYFMMKTLDKI